MGNARAARKMLPRGARVADACRFACLSLILSDIASGTRIFPRLRFVGAHEAFGTLRLAHLGFKRADRARGARLCLRRWARKKGSRRTRVFNACGFAGFRLVHAHVTSQAAGFSGFCLVFARKASLTPNFARLGLVMRFRAQGAGRLSRLFFKLSGKAWGARCLADLCFELTTQTRRADLSSRRTT